LSIELQKGIQKIIEESGDTELITIWTGVKRATNENLDDKVYNRLSLAYQSLEAVIVEISRNPQLGEECPKLVACALAAIRLIASTRDDVDKLIEVSDSVRDNLLAGSGVDPDTDGAYNIKVSDAEDATPSAEDLERLFNEGPPSE
jgi:hypothetical protein